MGVIVLNVQAVLRVYDAVAGNKPMIERVIALRGPGFTENQYATVRVGSPLQSMKGWIKDERSLRFVVDNLLTGFSCTDSSLPIGRSFNSIIAIPEQVSGGFLSFAAPGFTKDSYSRTFVSSFVGFKKKVNTNIHGEERPCIFCGYCEDVCPVGITPHLIYHNVERNKIEEKLAIYRIFNCIDCNLCTYVCPSKIQIASYIKEGKKKLRDSGLDESTVIFPNFHLKGIQKSIDTDKGTAK
jgi:Na(+)-translocating NADH:ubiquinone oxidoreductase A subunit